MVEQATNSRIDFEALAKAVETSSNVRGLEGKPLTQKLNILIANYEKIGGAYRALLEVLLTTYNADHLRQLSESLEATSKQIHASEQEVSKAVRESVATLESAERNLGDRIDRLTNMLDASNKSAGILQTRFLIATICGGVATLVGAIATGWGVYLTWNAPREMPPIIKVLNQPPPISPPAVNVFVDATKVPARSRPTQRH